MALFVTAPHFGQQTFTCQHFGENILTIGARLLEERTRMGMNQTEVAARGGVGKATQINYEKGERIPDASYLQAIADEGADVLYIVTGKRGSASEGTLSEAESTLLARWRSGSPALRGYLQEVTQTPAATSGYSVSIGGDVGQQIHGDQTITAPMTFTMGGKRK